MTAEEIKLVVSLARDPSYPIPDWANAVATRQWLLTSQKIVDDCDYAEAVEDGDRIFLFVEDLVVFLREYCLYDDFSPNQGPLTQWLRLLGTPAVALADITPESWNNLLTSKVIQKMSN